MIPLAPKEYRDTAIAVLAALTSEPSSANQIAHRAKLPWIRVQRVLQNIGSGAGVKNAYKTIGGTTVMVWWKEDSTA